MDVKVIDESKSKGTLTLMVKGSPISYSNTIRRMIMNRVPTMAIEEVSIKKNDSVLYDEIIAHRLGLVPLKTDLKSYVLPEQCKCKGEGCARCQLKLTLSTKATGIVSAGKIKSQDPKVIPVYENMPIVKLLEGQQLQLEATAVLGIGEDHAKFSPGTSYHKYAPEIIISSKGEDKLDVAEICPKSIFEVKNKKLSIVKDNVNDCHLCNACSDLSNGAVTALPNKDQIISHVESFGQISPKEMVTRATEVFDDVLDDFIEQIKNLK